MSRRAPSASVLLALICSTICCAAEFHDDFERAAVTWAEAAPSSYAYEIRYWAKGCLVVHSEVNVVNSKVVQVRELSENDACSNLSKEVEDRVVNRGITELLMEIVSFQMPGAIDATIPTEMKFHSALGYPLRFRLNANFDEKVFEIPKGSSIPSDYEYEIRRFRTLKDEK